MVVHSLLKESSMKQLQSIKAISRIMALTGLSSVRAAESTRMIEGLSVNKELDCQTLSAVSGGLNNIEDMDIDGMLAMYSGTNMMQYYLQKLGYI
jgi:hypothetical protein